MNKPVTTTYGAARRITVTHGGEDWAQHDAKVEIRITQPDPDVGISPRVLSTTLLDLLGRAVQSAAIGIDELWEPIHLDEPINLDPADVPETP